MPKCYKNCKHNICGVCQKYNERILVSKNPVHYGLLIHPFECLTIYYNSNNQDVTYLVKQAKKYLTNDISKSICSCYKEKGHISYKQRKILLHQLFDCYEEKEKY